MPYFSPLSTRYQKFNIGLSWNENTQFSNRIKHFYNHKKQQCKFQHAWPPINTKKFVCIKESLEVHRNAIQHYKFLKGFPKSNNPDLNYNNSTCKKNPQMGCGVNTIGDNSAGLWRYFEFFSSEFENSGERGCFRNAKPEIDKLSSEILSSDGQSKFLRNKQKRD